MKYLLLLGFLVSLMFGASQLIDALAQIEPIMVDAMKGYEQ